MHKTTARDIQVFVGGALAITGFRILLWIPRYFAMAGPLNYLRIFAGLITGLSLAIGIAILLNRPSAVLWAQIYLWLDTILACIVIPIAWFVHPHSAEPLTWISAPELLGNIALLWLLVWSRSQKFAVEPQSSLTPEKPEGTPNP